MGLNGFYFIFSGSWLRWAAAKGVFIEEIGEKEGPTCLMCLVCGVFFKSQSIYKMKLPDVFKSK